MKTINFLLLILFVGTINNSLAQTKATTKDNQIWLGYLNQTRLSNKWGVWTDLQLRTKEDFVDNFSQSIARVGLTYYLTEEAKLTAGYAYITSYPEGARTIAQPEHRPWQQIQWHTKYPKLRLMQWFRLEERYRRNILNNTELADGYNFNWRLRYNILAQFPLSKNKFQPNTFSFVLNNEIHVNFGKQIVYNYFDQNRFFAGFAYHLNKHDNLQFGYMNLFQQLPAGNKYKSNSVARLFYFHNLDLRKKTK
ncbi:DUF2490 domain-containing protein [Ferruginibacter sp. SUN002]|uniref:DUF2490 domain-containing protein n=1 Tax=Ferruginibacter sp. SUN002 TaxID=2937789 RepID=UPI003D360173